MPGWASVTANIVVAFWPSQSRINGLYGPTVVLGTNETMVLNGTVIAGDAMFE